jgi:CRP-like cAMP-binding protein
VATLPEGSTFGETGFLLGEPRTADVVTDEECVVVQVAHDSNLFDPLIRTDRADGLRRRFWVIHSLLRSGIFRNIPSDCFDALVHSGHFREFESGQWLCREGQTGESCHLIVQGSVIVSQRQRNIRRLKQGDCFGEVALILSRGARTASVYSQTDVLTLELSKASFYRLLAENFVLGCEFEKVAIQRWLADRARRTA